MMKKTLAGAAAILFAASLTACGGSSDGGSSSSSGGYCDDIQNAKSAVDSADFQNLTDATFQDLLDQINTVKDEAPSDIQDDWATVADTLDQFNTALHDAGLTFDDLSSISAGNLPDGVDPAKLQDLATKLQSLNSDAVTTAQDNITSEVKSECGIDLNSSSSSSPSSSS